ncbi:DNA/RNA non-specific endonuclease [Acetobacteraceae bacterium]|nr:DNA/RNA non-specific endonuclease [Acetobacteraceae bacterium]
MSFKKYSFALIPSILLVFPFVSMAESCPNFFLGGLKPKTPQEAILLCNEEFAVGYNLDFHDPLWSAEHLTRSEIEKARALHGRANFHEDHRIPTYEEAHLNDYRKSGWVRGHLTPSGDMPDWKSRYETYALTNVMPQNGKMNSGPWEHIEQETRSDAVKDGEVYVVTGSAFLHSMGEIGAGKVKIASAMWKAIYLPEEKEAWVLMCENGEKSFCRRMNLSQMIKLTGIEPFPALFIEKLKMKKAEKPNF